MHALLIDGPADGERLQIRRTQTHGPRLVVLSYSADGYYSLDHGPIEQGLDRTATWQPDAYAAFSYIRRWRSRPRLSRP